MDKTFKLWIYIFKKRYRAMTGEVWEEIGNDEEAKHYFDWNYTPNEAVMDQVLKASN